MTRAEWDLLPVGCRYAQEVRRLVLYSRLNWMATIALPVILVITSCTRQDAVHARTDVTPAVRVVPAVTMDIPLDIASIGNVEAVASVDVKSRVAGQVAKVFFGEGQDVRAGELLFEIDREPLLSQVGELEANIVRDEAQEKQALANVAKDEAQLKSDSAKAERGNQLLKERLVSKEQAETVVAAADSSRAILLADRAAVESAKAAKHAAEAKLVQTRLQLGYTRIMAPMSGRTGTISIKQGSLVKENDTMLVTILQTTPIHVSFSVPEQLLPEVRRYNAQRPLVVEAVAADNATVQG